MTRGLARIRLVLLLAVGVLVAGFGVLAYGLDMFRRLELDSVDARFSIRDEKKPPPGIVMVAVDTTTFSELDRQWPFPRSRSRRDDPATRPRRRQSHRVRRAGAQ